MKSIVIVFNIFGYKLTQCNNPNFNLSAEQRGNEPGFNTTTVQPQRHCSAHHKHLNTTVWLQHNCNTAQQVYGKADAKSQGWSAITLAHLAAQYVVEEQRVKIH